MRTFVIAVLAVAGGCSNETVNIPGVDMKASGADMAMGSSDSGASGMCDLIKQDCPMGQKCVAANVGTQQNPMLGTECVPLASMVVGLNQTCMRAMGMDNCDKGLSCSTVGAPAGMRVCLKVCAAGTDCPSTEKCVAGFGAGVCVKSCTPFGSDCASGMTCSSFQSDIASTMNNDIIVPVCRTIGTTMLGGTCMRSSECGANAGCLTDTGTCAQICDDTHICRTIDHDAGMPTCTPLAEGSSLGVCE
jgi:hypothetical protein